MVGIALGIIVDSKLSLAPAAGAILFTVVAGGLAAPSVRRRAAALLAVIGGICCGAVLHHHAFLSIAADDVATFTTAEDSPARVTGRIASEPLVRQRGQGPFESWQFGSDRVSFVLQADAIEAEGRMRPATGLVTVSVKTAALTARRADRVEVFGWLYRPRGPRNPGQFDWALFNARRGIRACLSCDDERNVRVLGRDNMGTDALLTAWRNRVRTILLDDRIESSDEGASLLDAVVLGRRAGIDRDMERSFLDTGCAHFLAVSGLNVGMLACAIWFPARIMGVDRRRCAVVVMLMVVAYALLAEPCPPIIRAAIMTCALCAAMLLRQRRWMTAALSLALTVLVFDPLSLFDIGFQLSFITVAGIVYLAPVVQEGIEASPLLFRKMRRGGAASVALIDASIAEDVAKRHERRSFHRAALTALSVSLTAWACSLPIVASGFGRVSPWGWMNSIIAAPLVFVVMLLGFAKLAVGAVWPILARPVDVALDLLVRLLLEVMNLLSRLPGTVIDVTPPPWWLSALFYLCLVCVAAWRRGLIGRRTAGGVCAALGIGALAWAAWPSTLAGVRVTQLAVGRGTSSVIELPDGQVWLYDAGSSGADDPGERIVAPYLRQRGIRRLDGIVLSHPNLDHFSGVPSLTRMFRCGPVYVSSRFEPLSGPGTPSRALLDALSVADHPVRVIDGVPDGDATRVKEVGVGVSIEILWPPPDLPADVEANDTSLVMRLRHQGRSILFTGDLDVAAQRWLIEHEDLSADVLMLPHHGAVVSTTAEFLSAVGASHVIRSSFERDADSPILMRLVGDATLHNTGEVGAVTVLVGDGGDLRVFGFVDDAVSSPRGLPQSGSTSAAM
jgi:competence protein ComEC